MYFLKSLYQAHVLNVAATNRWCNSPEMLPDYRAWLRAETYLRLDILISELQKETASIHNLQGIDAVRILVSRHSALSIIEVRHLSFSELIFLLQPALESANIPPEVIQYPPHVDEQLQDVPYNQRAGLTPCSEVEWDHSLLKKYQDLYNPQ
ncbi:hypothetical protein A8327_004805 [Escherichia coli]|uniref:ECs1072 family phage-associated protein n=1 Tax=Escherichia coli TaxID=562 RepID=UPI0010772CA3|nr:hypothetical protein [Escherichia coli]EEC7187121.1 hypothetical protein [Escherichia coli]EED0676332.1 hypothetical protein [Escherichia coli]EER5613318.1 hypothetical protein [Escherichia coli]EES0251227.1 hypothetical protein [Escherichia coli]EES0634877.1 hypothetical protein [Escherichia coli]